MKQKDNTEYENTHRISNNYNKKIILQSLFYDNGNVSINNKKYHNSSNIAINSSKKSFESIQKYLSSIEKFLNNIYYFCFCLLCINETSMISMIVSECVIDHDQRETVKE